MAPIGFTYHTIDNVDLTNPAYVEQIVIRFNWDDSDVVTKVHTPHYFDFNVGTWTTNNGVLDKDIFNKDIYSALASSGGLGTAPTNQVRLMNRCDFTVYVSTREFYNYQAASLTQGTGLTGSEIEPVYTNVQGKSALGLFTSRGIRSGKITITPATIESMRTTPLLSHTKVVGTTYHQ